MSYPAEIEQGTSFLMRVRVINADEWDKRAVVIRLPQRFFAAFHLAEMTPLPDDHYISGGTRCFVYDEIPPQSALQVEMRLVPQRVGVSAAELTLFGPDGTIFARRRLQLTTL